MSRQHYRTGNMLASFVSVVVRHPWLTVATVFGLTGLSLRYTAGNLDINTDTADMISSELSWRQDFTAYREGFPSRDRNIVIVIDGADAETNADYAREFAAALAAEPDLYPSVFLAGSGDFFDRNGLLYLSLDELETLADRLIVAQPLLGRLAADAGGAGILAETADILGRADADELAGDDLERMLDEIGLTIGAVTGGLRRPIAWGNLLGTDGLSSDRQIILVQPTVDFVNRIRAARDAIDRIRELDARLSPAYGGETRLRLTGTLVMEDEELMSVARSAAATGFLALAMVIAVLLWSLRSIRLLLIAVVTLLTGLSLTAAFAALTVGELNLLSVAFAVLYIGLGVDFVLHLTLRLKELCRDGVGVAAGLTESARGVGHSLVICALTTAVGFLAFIPTDFVGISQLGLIAGGGMLISLAVSLSFLPALIFLFWTGKPGVVARAARRGLWRFGWHELPARPVFTVAIVLVVASLFALPGLDFDGNPIHLRDPSAESIETLEDLAADSAAPIFTLAVLTPNPAAAEATAADLAGLETVESVRTPASLVPTGQAEKLLVIEDLELYLGSTLARFRVPDADSSRLAPALDNLREVLESAPRQSPARGRLLDAMRRWQAAFGSLDTAERGARAAALDRDIRGNLVEQVQRLGQGLNAERFGFEDLPEELRSRVVNSAGQALVEIVPKENLNDNAAAARFVAEVKSVAPTATGLPVVYEQAAATVTRAFAFAVFYAFVAVTLMLVLFLGSVRDTLLVLVPIVVAAILTAALAEVLGLPLNFANIIALPLLIGVGVDSGIHMVHRMRTEPPAGGDPLKTSTSRAVLASALTTIASFGNLAFSEHLGMASMGRLLTLGMLMSLLSVLVLLPALMRIGKTP